MKYPFFVLLPLLLASCNFPTTPKQTEQTQNVIAPEEQTPENTSSTPNGASSGNTSPVTNPGNTSSSTAGTVIPGGDLIGEVIPGAEVCGTEEDADLCTAFKCKEVRELIPSADGTIDIPRRTHQGICYTMKLMNGIANSASELTPDIAYDVVSRDHGSPTVDASGLRNPFQMGRSTVNFKLNGLRRVKIAGAMNSTASILVDNFILTAIYPRGVQPSPSQYAAFGTADSTVDGVGVLLNDQLIPLTPFNSWGTSQIEPLDITKLLPATGAAFTVDIRALDCGGIRELSDLYLLFQ